MDFQVVFPVSGQGWSSRCTSHQIFLNFTEVAARLVGENHELVVNFGTCCVTPGCHRNKRQ